MKTVKRSTKYFWLRLRTRENLVQYYSELNLIETVDRMLRRRILRAQESKPEEMLFLVCHIVFDSEEKIGVSLIYFETKP